MKYKLLQEPSDAVSVVRRNLKSALALKYAKAQLHGELQLQSSSHSSSHGAASSSAAAAAAAAAAAPGGAREQRGRGSGAGDAAGVSGKSSKSSGTPLLSEIWAVAEQGHLPIIVVPPASSASRGCRLHAGNVEKFLVQGSFESATAGPPAAGVGSGGRTAGTPVATIERHVGGRVTKFRVYDDTAQFRKFEWKAVVAVVADGKRWQFSGWPFRSEADLFASVKGFHVKFVDEPAGALAAWNVQTLNLKREGRHQDASVAAEFWKALETFLLKPNSRKFSNEHKL